MKTFRTLTVGTLLLASLSLPTASFAVTTTQTHQKTALVKMNLHYQDSQGHQKSTMVYVAKDKTQELKQAKKIELLSVLGYGRNY